MDGDVPRAVNGAAVDVLAAADRGVRVINAHVAQADNRPRDIWGALVPGDRDRPLGIDRAVDLEGAAARRTQHGRLIPAQVDAAVGNEAVQVLGVPQDGGCKAAGGS